MGFSRQVTPASLIPQEDEGESFIVTLLTKDKTVGRSGNERKGAALSVFLLVGPGSCEETRPEEREREAAHVFFILLCFMLTAARRHVDLGKTF